MGEIIEKSIKMDFVVDKLESDNYTVWKWQAMNILRAKNLVDALNANASRDVDRQALALIGSALDKDNKMLVVGCSTAKEVWDRLESVYENKTTFEKQELLSKLHSFKIDTATDIAKPLGEIQTLVSRLKMFGENVSDDALMSIIMNALPKCFENFLVAFKLLAPETRTLQHLISNVIARSREISVEQVGAALLAVNVNSKDKKKAPRSKKSDICNYCKKAGHWARDCRKLQRRKQKEDEPKKNEPKKNEESHEHEEKKEEDVVSFMVVSGSIGKMDWVADSGCSLHMTPNLHWLDNYKNLEKPAEVRFGNNDVGYAEGYGDIHTKSGTMNNVYYVPGLITNLFSVSAATSRGLTIYYVKDRVDIFFNNKLIVSGIRKNGVYVLNLEVRKTIMANIAATIDEWHEKLVHISKDDIRKMSKNKIVSGLEIVRVARDPDCEDCALNKCQRTNHPERKSPKADKPGQILHMDTVGPISVPSLNKSRYFVLCKDEFSHYRLVEFVSSKTEIPIRVKMLITKSNLETNNKLLQLCTDNGSEFVNNELENYLAKLGVYHRKSAPYTPQQNGFVEREVRTVTEAARTILAKSKLPTKLWAESVNTVVYTLNRCINSVLNSITPFELWFGRKPDVGNLLTFGQELVVLDPKTKTKWDSRGLKCIFVGYTDNYNTYRVYLPSIDRITISSDVKKFRSPKIIEISDKPIITEINDESNEKINQENYSDIAEKSTTSIEVNVTNNKTHPEVLKTSNAREFPLRSGQQIRIKPNESDEHTVLLTTIEADQDPSSYKEAMSRPDHEKWKEAMECEMLALAKNGTWVLVDRPKDKNIVSNRWVLRIKRNPDGSIDRYRARLVARGFSQVYGVDYNDTYAPVVNTSAVRMLFAFSTIMNLQIEQFDVKTAFLYGSLDEEVYMSQPEGFEIDRNRVCLLKRSLYGLKQSPRQWNLKFKEFLKDVGLIEAYNDASIFYRKEPLLILSIYVDDGLILARHREQIDLILEQMKERFEIHTVSLSTYLGFQIIRQGKDTILHQTSYISKILRKFNMQDCTPVESPVSTYSMSDAKLREEVPFREAIGSLMYAAVTTRIDIMLAVSLVSRKVENPSENDWLAVKRIFRYLKGKEHYGLRYRRTNEKPELQAFCDANFASDVTSKSTSGLVILFGGGPVHWRSQLQRITTLSSTEAELVSLCSAMKDIVWLRKLARELELVDNSPIELRCDNQSAIKLAINEKCSQRTRHMMVRAAYSREQIENRNVNLKYVKAQEQLADMLTKPVSNKSFTLNRNKLMYISLVMPMILCSLCNSALLERTGPIIWRTTDKIVYADRLMFKIAFEYINPCKQFDYDSNVNPHGDAKDKCYQLFRTEWTERIENLLIELPKPAAKRQASFIFGIFVLSNLVSTISSYMNPLHVVGDGMSWKQFKEYRENRHARDEIISRLIESTGSMNADLMNLRESYKKNWGHLYESVWSMILIHAEITKKGNLLSKIIDKAIQKRQVATKELGILFNITNYQNYYNHTFRFSDIRPENTQFINAEKLRDNTILIEFSTIIESTTTKVYKIDAFDHWINLTEQNPVKVRYIGKDFLIYNSSSRCKRAVLDSEASVIAQHCLENDFSDRSLDLWEPTSHNQEETAVKFTGLFNYIYCWSPQQTNFVEIGNIKHNCPSSVFRITSSKGFKTKDITIDAESLELNFTLKDLALDDLHFNTRFEDNQTNTELELIKELRNAKLQLSKLDNDQISIDRYNFTWLSLISGKVILIVGIVIGFQLSKRISLKGFNLTGESCTPGTHSQCQETA